MQKNPYWADAVRLEDVYKTGTLINATEPLEKLALDFKRPFAILNTQQVYSDYN